MNVRILGPLAVLCLACLGVCGVVSGQPVIAAETDTAQAPAPDLPAQSAGPLTPAEPADDDGESDDSGANSMHRHHHRHHGDSVVMIGRNATLAAGRHADAVVSIDGSSASAGDAQTVVSVFGDTHVTGAVADSAVSVLGSTYVDSAVEGDVVAVLGNVELGPHANVGGDVVAVGGEVRRAPSAIVHGTVQSVAGYGDGFHWLRPWIEHCLFYGRPLAFVPGIDWAWGVAIAMLVLYLCFALVFREGVTRCVHTLETQPGMALLAALLSVLLWPLLLVLLGITVVGLAAVPLVLAAVLCAALFGKAVVLTALGRRCMGGRARETLGHPAVALLIGGLVALVLYVIPVIGLIAFHVLGLVGLGAVIYTLVLEIRSRRGTPTGGASEIPPASTVAATAGSPAAPAAPGVSGAPGAPEMPKAGEAAASAALEPTAAGAPHAGFWIRTAALLVDALAVAIPTSILSHEGMHLHLVLLAIYGATMWKLKGATIGCLVFDLRVVRQDGRPIEWETAIVRALGCFLSLAVAGLGFFWIAFDPAKLAWHDKIAGTAVVRVSR